MDSALPVMSVMVSSTVVVLSAVTIASIALPQLIAPDARTNTTSSVLITTLEDVPMMKVASEALGGGF